jgi:ADP-ribose pyrophosphatase
LPNTTPETGQPVDLADAPQQWTVHEVEDVWSGPAPFSVHRDQVSAPGRPDEPFGRLVLQHPGAVVVLALDDEERALVLHQYRHPVQMRLVELPAGLLDVAGEDPLEAAKRELQEEGLVVADRWSHLLTTVPSPGLSSERIETYLAEGLHPAVDRGGFEPEHEEADMTVSWVPVRDLLDGVLAGRLTNGPLALAVMAYRLR